MFFHSFFWNTLQSKYNDLEDGNRLMKVDPDAKIVLLGDPQMEGDSRISREGLYGN